MWIVGHGKKLAEEEEGQAAGGANPSTGHIRIIGMISLEFVKSCGRVWSARIVNRKREHGSNDSDESEKWSVRGSAERSDRIEG